MKAHGDTTRRSQRGRRLALMSIGAAATMMLAACGGGGGFEEEGAGAKQKSDAPLSILIGSSGDAETKAVEDAVKSWSDDSGVKAEVQVASDLNQQLAQGFAGGQPPDVFYLSTDQLASYASNGSLEPYAADLGNADAFFPALRDAFTYDDEFWCAPKDFSTLALVINTKLWEQAGLTDADVPTDWDGLRAAAEKLTKGKQVGLVFGPEYQRIGTFFEQNGGGLTNDEGTEATVNSPENVEALTFVKDMMKDGVAAYSSDVGAGWGGEAFGVMPSVEAAADEWKSSYPDLAAFIEGADSAANLPTQEGAADVISEMNAQLATLKNKDPQQILDSVQKNMEAVVSQ